MAQKFLGVDYGAKRVGVALSDDGGIMAFPKLVLQNNRELVSRIAEICRNESVSAVVLGKSTDYGGEDNPVMKKISDFKRSLEKETGLSVYLEPEYLSSAQAERIQGKNQSLDASAAAIILQSFLDKRDKRKNLSS